MISLKTFKLKILQRAVGELINKEIYVIFCFLFANSQASAQAQLTFSPNISGQYQCTIQDSQGESFHSQVTYTLDAKNSDLSKSYSTYHFDGISQYGTHYLGEAIAQNNQLAIYAYNTSSTKPNDVGVEISTISQQKPSAMNKNPRFILNNLMYSPKNLHNPDHSNDPGSVISITCEEIIKDQNQIS